MLCLNNFALSTSAVLKVGCSSKDALWWKSRFWLVIMPVWCFSVLRHASFVFISFFLYREFLYFLNTKGYRLSVGWLFLKSVLAQNCHVDAAFILTFEMCLYLSGGRSECTIYIKCSLSWIRLENPYILSFFLDAPGFCTGCPHIILQPCLRILVLIYFMSIFKLPALF